ncbi:MAG: hypothetical protein Q8Q08_02860 [Candidatus Omnitrophota bacterium]|nr:hypothetical protein [Candidatus Omnitrophota bacterium]MDZ4241544.1 hypothetical protein [Candidatus Omnitrophota bacterium]
MTLLFVRAFFLIICGFVGSYLGSIQDQSTNGMMAGVASGFVLIFAEMSLRRVSVRGLSSMVFGLLLGFFMAKLLTDILSLLPLGEFWHSVLRVILTLIFSYLGAVMALRGKDEFHVIIPYVRFKRQEMGERVILLDTSAIIDGRIADIYKTGFVPGRLLVPRFVLQELQKISDAHEEIKRQRGRRGMEILKTMQKDTKMNLIVREDDVPGSLGVDAKLVQLAKMMDGSICTMDANLGHVASLQGVEVLNINELADSVKPVVLTGEEIETRLVKEGKEPNQAVGYLDDGTMIVVADGRRMIGQKVGVLVTSVLQTQSGRMIFAKLKA